MYDENGTLVWECELDIYGKAKIKRGNLTDVPFRWQGQMEDEELGGVYINRFRIFDSNTGTYISQDPIGLQGGISLYAYVENVNLLYDPFGLTPWGDMGISFGKWWNNYATPASISANKSSVENALRSMNGGSNHEMFPVSMAEKAKDLKFKYKDLKKLTVKTKDIEFHVLDKRGNPISGGHPSSGVPNNSASSIFHRRLMNDLDGAKTKQEAMDIIKKHHDANMKFKNYK